MTFVWIDCDLLEHPKVAQLPSDAARLGFVAVIFRAKRQAKPGRFANEQHFRYVMGRFGKFLPAYIAQHLIDVEADGVLSVHDWYDYQRDKVDTTAADRQRRYRERHRNGDSNDVTDVTDNASHAGGRAVALPVDVDVNSSGLGSGEGVKHLVALQAVTLLPIERIDAKTRREFDRLADQRGPENVAVAIREAADRIPTQPPAARQLMVEVLRILEPFSEPKNGNHAKGYQPSASEAVNAFRS